MSVCLQRQLHTHLRTHTRECDKGSVVGMSAGVEIRSCGNGAGGLLLVLWEGVGAWRDGRLQHYMLRRHRQQNPIITSRL